MTHSDMIKALTIIEAKQKDTAPVTVQIGCVINHTVYHDSLVLKEAPPAVVRLLMEQGFSLDMRADGLHIDKY